MVVATSAKEVVVFVHGLAGFGDDELGPIDYWAELDEFPRDRFDVFVASVGPVSSNWDRACELYAQIKGTREGVPAEVSAGSTSPLFAGLGNMIKSVTTISTPHDGTPLIDVLGEDIVELIKDLILGFAGITGNTFVDLIYDFDLDHFGLGRQSGESFGDYVERVCANAIFDMGFRDLAPYDLSIDGSRELQQQGQQAYSNTFYFGMATEQTVQNVPWCEWGYGCGLISVAEATMGLLLQPFANIIGSLRVASDLRKNDGLVPFESSKCPKIGYSNGANGCTKFTGTWAPGRWYWMEVDRDHLQVIGFTFLYALTNDAIYSNHAERIWGISGGNTYVGSSNVGDGTDEVSEPEQTSNSGLVVMSAAGGACVALALVGAAYVVRRRRMRAATANATSTGSVNPKDFKMAAAQNPMYDV
ncbi:Hypothetical Protein FCC1311_065581 [Hondaea fermentalgiana]|uniref:Lipase-like C-terminal domain-containing protein n=1 Tax=Hondaea fermentalgiana TaxID=2315210 RepID=A0A2R5GR35_9STRA|nr:Hypothetical Protein FCC1311_065581 [Hondaea fermentalgiana]|eukprot:GBG32218.1 Hypothetical Protein FCC1311_065581 [Hondaea fermentalgiana]